MPFKDIIGHKEVIAKLQELVATQHYAHAYLFTGPDGVGKKLTAVAFAQVLNCLQPQNEGLEACGQCLYCRKIQEATHTEIKIISPEEKVIKIKQIHQLQQEIVWRPVNSKIKVYIINDAHLLTTEAANCLLKTLEEPPANSLIILVTSYEDSLLPTIRSRCQKIKFSFLAPGEVEQILKKQYDLAKEEFNFLAYFCGGSVGKAEQYYQAGIFGKREELIQLLQETSNGNIEVIFSKIPEITKEKINIEIWLALLLVWYRDFIILKNGQKKKFILLNTQNISQELRQKWTEAPIETLRQNFSLIFETKQQLYKNINVTLALENIFLRMSEKIV